MASVKGFDSLTDDFFGDFLEDLSQEFSANYRASNIIEFLETEVDIEAWLGPGGALNERQLTLLKAYDGMPLEDNEIALMQAWKALGRTTYDLDVGPKKRQSFVLECGRNGSKCSDFRTTFILSDGIKRGYEILNEVLGSQLFTITQTAQEAQSIAQQLGIVGKDFEYIKGVALEGKSKRANTGRFFVKGLSKTKKITTKAGYNIEGTPEHRVKVLTQDGVIAWKYFSDIEVGDYIAIHKNTNLFPTEYVIPNGWTPKERHQATNNQKSFTPPPVINEAWGYLIGLLVADGLWTQPNRLQISCHEEDVENATKAFTDCGLSPTYSVDKRSTFGRALTYYGVEVRDFLDYLGYSLQAKPKTKLTPWVIRSSPKSVQAAYLSGLFDGDGFVDKRGHNLSLSSASLDLIRETQLILLNFGVVSSITTSTVNKEDYYQLTIIGKDSLRIFMEEAGLRVQRRATRIANYFSSSSSKSSSEVNAIPYQIHWLQRLRGSLPDNTGQYFDKKPGDPPNVRSEYRAIVGNAIKKSTGEKLSSKRVERFLPLVEQYSSDQEAVKHFQHLLDCDYFYTPVVSVEESTAFCVDLWVPGHQQYVAQGMTNHNTFLGAIIIGYEWYKLCMLPNPQQFFGVASSTLISIYCLAPAASQVKKTIFGQARAFLNYIPKVKRLIDNKSIIIGEEEIKYHDKLLYIYAGNSKGSSQVGSRVILLVMDEVARFENKDGKSNALELWSNIGVSGITFGEHARRVAISSAWRDGDAIQRLYTAAMAEDSWIGFRFRTWDLNPLMNRNNPIVASEYTLNPASARLEFEGDRTTSAFTYFSETEVLEATTGRSVIKLEPMQLMPDKMVRLQLHSLEKNYSHHTYMHLDPAFVKDAYAMAFGHGERRDDQDVVVIDGLAAWEPEGGSVVSILNVYDIITTIHASRPIYKLTTDHAQQHETIQRLRLLGINASSRFWSNRVQVEIYDFTRKLVHEGRLILPKDSYWTALLKSEMMGIIHDTERGKIMHPPDGCFVGETRIPLLDGTRPMISELEGKEVWVYSAKPDGTIVPGKARGRKTKQVTELLDVVLDSGAVIRCTPEHPFMLRNGDYIKAEDIVPGFTRLMPINFQWPVQGGYEKVSSIQGRYLTHHMSLNYPDLKGGKIVHHINHIKTDNRPENLEVLDHSEHCSYHSTLAHNNDLEFRKKLSEGTIEFNKRPETRAKRSAYMKSQPKEFYVERNRKASFFRANVTLDSLLRSLEHGASNAYQAAIFLDESRNTITRVLRDEGFSDWQEFENKYIDRKDTKAGTFSFKGKVIMVDSDRTRSPKVSIQDIHGAVQSGLSMMKDVAAELQCSVSTLRIILKRNGYETWNDFVKGGLGENHKVREIIKVTLLEPVDVYDLEVDEWDNFALAAGVIVHNSKDLIDSVCSVAWEIAGVPMTTKALPKMVGRPSVMRNKVRDWGSDSQRRSLVRQARTKGQSFTDDFDDGGFGF
jgi:intein/homing endonuclease